MAYDVPMSPMSPDSRRRAEFTIKQLQSGVLGKARSTLSTLGDVWRPKSGLNKTSQSTKSTSNKTLEFLSLWSTRHKKSASDKCAAAADENATTTRDKLLTRSSTRQPHKSVLVDTSNKKNTLVTNVHEKSAHSSSTDQQMRSRRRRHNVASTTTANKCSDDNVTITTNRSATATSAKRYLRNNSLDMSLMLSDSRSRNIEQDIERDDIVIANTDDYPTAKVRRNSYVDQYPIDDWAPARMVDKFTRASAELDSRIIRARLKLQTFITQEAAKEVTASPKPGILHRPSSVIAQGLARQNSEDVQDSGSLRVPPQRPRKKLSFREPVENHVKPFAIKSDTLPRAQRFLEKLERQKHQLESDAELEVSL